MQNYPVAAVGDDRVPWLAWLRSVDCRLFSAPYRPRTLERYPWPGLVNSEVAQLDGTIEVQSQCTTGITGLLPPRVIIDVAF